MRDACRRRYPDDARRHDLHAAVVARGMGKPCVSGAGAIRIDMVQGTMSAGGKVLKRGDFITIDGSNGQVLLGEIAMLQPELSGRISGTLFKRASRSSSGRMKIRTNAETPNDARTAANSARKASAAAPSTCSSRAQHAMREMILADDEKGRRAALEKLLPMQRSDFIELFEIMKGMPVTIRLLDPPLAESRHTSRRKFRKSRKYSWISS